MIIWRGIGFLVAVLLFGGLVLAQLVADSIGGPDTYSENVPLYAGFGLIIGGALTYLLARWDESRNPERNLVDQKTGQEVIIRNRSEFFFIPMRYWGLLAMVVGPMAVVAGLLEVG